MSRSRPALALLTFLALQPSCRLEDFTPQDILLIDPVPDMLDPGPPGPTPETWECDIDAVPDFIHPADLETLLRIVNVLSEGDEEELDRLCAYIKDTFIDPIRHSTGEDYPPDLEKQWVAIKARYWRRWDVEVRGEEATAPTDATFRVASSAIDEAFPCGEGEIGFTLCQDYGPMPEGEILMLAMVLGADVPMDDAVHHHQYAFVFDANGDATDNYEAVDAYPYDFFDGTDQWLQALYSPGAGWSYDPVTARLGEIYPMATSARIVVAGNTIVALVPVAELGGQSCPEHRMTAFTHLGDYGLQPPHVWNGDTEPPVDEGLEGACD